jgi:hypothetical protein
MTRRPSASNDAPTPSTASMAATKSPTVEYDDRSRSTTVSTTPSESTRAMRIVPVAERESVLERDVVPVRVLAAGTEVPWPVTAFTCSISVAASSSSSSWMAGRVRREAPGGPQSRRRQRGGHRLAVQRDVVEAPG